MGNVPFCEKRRQALKASGFCRSRKGLFPAPLRSQRKEEAFKDPEKEVPWTSLLPDISTGAQVASSAALLLLYPERGFLYFSAGCSVGRLALNTKIEGRSLPLDLTSAALAFLLVDGVLYALPGLGPEVMLVLYGVAATAPLCTIYDASLLYRRKRVNSNEVNHANSAAKPTTIADSLTQRKILMRIFSWMSHDWLLWSAAYSSLFFTSAVGATLPVLSTAVVTAVTTPGGDVRGALVNVTGMLLFLTCVSSLESILIAESSSRLSVRIRKSLLSNLLQQDMEFFDSTSPGEIHAHLGAVHSVTSVGEKLTPAIIRSVVTTTTTFVLLCRFNSQLAMMCLAAVPLQVGVSRWYSKFHVLYSERLQKIQAKTGQIISEMVSSIKTVKILHAENAMSQKFWGTVSELIVLRSKNNWILVGNGFVEFFVPQMMSLLLFLYAGHLAVTQQVNVAELMTIAIYQRQLVSAFEAIGRAYASWGQTLGTSRMCFEYLDRVPQQTQELALPPTGLKGAIEFNNVQFGYAGSPQKVLQSFNLKVRPGEVLAIVGPSGAGKSTVIKLLLGLYHPEQGSVLVDGQPVSEYQRGPLFSQGLSVVSQEPTLFSMSFRDNIALGRASSLAQEQVESAAQAANAHDFIMASKEGYDTKVGSRGEKLSGGQKQRTAISRAMVRNPTILLLDEATSSLDAGSEFAVVQQALERATARGRTVVIVAHRLSTVQRADRIVVLGAQGRVVQEGTHAQLLADAHLNPTYANLVRKQLLATA